MNQVVRFRLWHYDCRESFRSARRLEISKEQKCSSLSIHSFKNLPHVRISNGGVCRWSGNAKRGHRFQAVVHSQPPQHRLQPQPNCPAPAVPQAMTLIDGDNESSQDAQKRPPQKFCTQSKHCQALMRSWSMSKFSRMSWAPAGRMPKQDAVRGSGTLC
jgi:hypothetical protein